MQRVSVEPGAEAVVSENSVGPRSIYLWGVRLLRLTLGVKPSNNAAVQLLRSLISSVVALCADFGFLVFFKEALGIHYLLAAALSFSIGIVVIYTLSV